MPTIKDVTDENLQRHLAIIRSAPKDSIIYRANQHLLDDSASVWVGGGLLEFAGIYWWTVSCDILLTGFPGLRGVLFSASGTGFTAGAYECEMAGTFVVDPATIMGTCNFTLGGGAVVEGVISLTLLSPQGALYGTFLGNATGVGVTSVNGTGSLQVG